MPWIDTFDNETRAYAATKGWDRLDGDAAALAIFKSYQNLEKTRPAPETVLSPRQASEYKFDGIAHADGAVPDSGFLEFARGLAVDLHLPPAVASTLAQRLVAFGDAAEKEAADGSARALQESTERLKTAWGDKYEANVAVATNAFEALKLPKETIDALVGSMGVDKVMEIGHNLGARMGEAPLLTGGSVDQKVPMTRAEALVERNRLTSDPEFGKKIMDGDKDALKQIEDLSRAIIGTQDNWQAAPANFGRTRENPTGDPAFRL